MFKFKKTNEFYICEHDGKKVCKGTAYAIGDTGLYVHRPFGSRYNRNGLATYFQYDTHWQIDTAAGHMVVKSSAWRSSSVISNPKVSRKKFLEACAPLFELDWHKSVEYFLKNNKIYQKAIGKALLNG